MATEEIVDGIYGVGMGYVNAFLVVEEAVSLIDSGVPKRMETVLGALRQLRKAERCCRWPEG